VQGERGRAKQAWVRTSLGGALAQSEDWAGASAALDHPAVHEAIARDPLPGLVARRWLGLSVSRLGDAARGSTLLSAGRFAYGDALEPSLSFVADVNALYDVAERARRGELDPDDARAVIARLASFEGATTRLARGLATAERALRSRARAAAALHRLAIEAGRLG
jgi:hypothetical protein